MQPPRANFCTAKVPNGIRWADIEALFIALGAEISERRLKGKRVFVRRDQSFFTAHTLRQLQTKGRLPASSAGWKHTE